jgi:molybdenum cofactor cytidylyltransferase
LIFSDMPLDEAEGALLAHSLSLAGRRVAKGTRIDRALLDAAAAAGVRRVWAAHPEPGDVPEADAAIRIAAALAGDCVEACPPVHGRVNLHAREAGILSATAIGPANRASEAIGIATLPPATPVRPNDLIATVKVIPFAMPEAEIAAILATGPRLTVHRFQPGLTARLFTTGDQEDKASIKAAAVTGERLARLGIPLVRAPLLPHRVADLAAALAVAPEPLLLVAGAAATADPADVIPSAIEAAGGTVLRVGMPVDPGNLLVLGRVGTATVIGLPGCARSPKRNGLDLVLERLAAGLEVTSATIADMGLGGLLEGSGNPVPWAWSG